MMSLNLHIMCSFVFDHEFNFLICFVGLYIGLFAHFCCFLKLLLQYLGVITLRWVFLKLTLY